MADRAKTSRRGSWFPAVDPESGGKFEVLIPQRRIRWAHQRGKGAILEMVHLVTAILEKPRQIYEGIRSDSDEDRFPRGEDDGWLCYSASPGRGFDYDSGEEIPRLSRVLLVFVNRERVVYHWRWEEESDEKPGTPADCDGRFSREAL